MLMKNLRSLGKSFLYAFKGIAYCIKNERNMRIHLCVTALVSLFSFYYQTTAFEYIVVFLCIGAVISGEMVNTAIETLVNLFSPSYNNLARIAKDVAAGAVFIEACVSIIVAGFVFINPPRLSAAFTRIITSPVAIISFVILIVLGIFFIFNGHALFGEKTMRIYNIRPHEKMNNKRK